MENLFILPKTAKQIKNSKDYVDIDGTIYTPVTNYKKHYAGHYHKKTQHIIHGYCYCGIYDDKRQKCVQRRVHRIVAETFLPNPDNLPIVGHKNNIKTDNRASNLYWTTDKENVQKAVNDGLLTNNKGFDDSQSKPVAMYDTLTNKKLGTYGSICLAAKETGLPKTTIARQARYHRPVRKPYYFRFLDDPSAVCNRFVEMLDYDTDRLLERFYSAADAARKTNTNEKTVGQQCLNGKPKHKFSDVYFKYSE